VSLASRTRNDRIDAVETLFDKKKLPDRGSQQSTLLWQRLLALAIG
jgi:hypothetical protein